MGGRRCFLCRTKANKAKRIVLHSFKNRPLIEKWLQVCGITEPRSLKRLLICTFHFKQDDYTCGNLGGHLIDTAVPSLNVPSPLPEDQNTKSQHSYPEHQQNGSSIANDARSVSVTGTLGNSGNVTLNGVISQTHAVWIKSEGNYILPEGSNILTGDDNILPEEDNILSSLKRSSENNELQFEGEINEEVWIKESPPASPQESEIEDTPDEPLDPLTTVDSVEPQNVEFWKSRAERWKQVAEKEEENMKLLEQHNKILTSRVVSMQAIIDALQSKLDSRKIPNFGEWTVVFRHGEGQVVLLHDSGIYRSYNSDSNRVFIEVLDVKSAEMPTECITDPLQRELADSIIRMVPLDDIRILLAGGAKVNEPVTQGLRPLHYAVWQRYAEAARLLLVRGGDVNARDECGYSALHLSAEHGYTELVKLLLRQGARVDYREDTDDPYPRTMHCDEPLRLAIRNGHFEVARVLLEHGANPNKRYFFGSEINLVPPMDLEFMRLLLTYGANPDAVARDGLTPLMKAARLPQGMDSVLLLVSFGADVNAMTDARHDFRTVLHYAVLSGCVATVNLLLKQGARVTFPPDYQQPTPLHLAVLRGDPELVRMLIKAGADPNASTPVIGSPLHLACADRVPHRAEIVQILLSNGADPNLLVHADDNLTLRPPIAEYVASSEIPNAKIVAMLLRYGARVIMKTQFRDPRGLLNWLQNVSTHPEVLCALLEAVESFDPAMIRRAAHLSDDQRALLLRLASTPLPLRHQVRLQLRRQLGPHLVDIAPDLPLPGILCRYLLFQFS